MKKLLTGLLSLAMFLGIVSPALAFQPEKVRVVNPWQSAKATPGNPVTLEGEGAVKAHGRGRVRYQVTEGTVKIWGRGVVGVKGSPDVKASGFGGKKQIGDWTYYYGTGHLETNGSNYEVIGWGGSSWWRKLNTTAQGKGKVTFRGWWTIKYRGHNTVQTHLDAVDAPAELQSEAGSDANLN